jgi:hypothetical protein
MLWPLSNQLPLLVAFILGHVAGVGQILPFLTLEGQDGPNVCSAYNGLLPTFCSCVRQCQIA